MPKTFLNKPSVSVAQHDLMEVRKTYKKAIGGSKENLDNKQKQKQIQIQIQIQKEKGYCFGLSIQWGLSKLFKKTDHFEMVFKLATWEPIRDKTGKVPSNKAFENTWTEIKKLHCRGAQMRVLEVLKNATGQTFERNFTVSGVFKPKKLDTSNELARLLKAAIKPQQVNLLHFENHAMGVYTEHENGPWYYYDSNEPNHEVVCETIDDLIEALETSYYRMLYSKISGLLDGLRPGQSTTLVLGNSTIAFGKREDSGIDSNEGRDFFYYVISDGKQPPEKLNYVRKEKLLFDILPIDQNFIPLTIDTYQLASPALTSEPPTLDVAEAEKIKNELYQDSDFITRQSAANVTALYLAAREGDLPAVKAILQNEQAKKFINLPVIALSDQSESASPLHVACHYGRTEVVEFLLEQGADVNFITGEGASALFFACCSGHTKIVELLLKKLKNNADIVSTVCNGTKVLIDASTRGHFDVVKLLLEFLIGYDVNVSTVRDGTEALSFASMNGHFDVVKLLIEYGVNVNDNSEGGLNNPLFCACWSGQTAIVELLLKNKADINLAVCGRMTALERAIKEGYVDIVKLFIEYGADVNQVIEDIEDKEEQTTPLYLACTNNRLEIVKLLLAKGARKNQPINKGPIEGSTPLSIACSLGHIEIVEYLVESKPEPEPEPDHDYNQVAAFGMTLLFTAAHHGQLEMVKFLLEKGADINLVCLDEGLTPLIIACMEGHLNVAQELLNRGADVTANCIDFGTALHYACKHGWLDLSKALVEKGAALNPNSMEGEFTPLHCAYLSGNVELIGFLNPLVTKGYQKEYSQLLNDSTPLSKEILLNHLKDKPLREKLIFIEGAFKFIINNEINTENNSRPYQADKLSKRWGYSHNTQYSDKQLAAIEWLKTTYKHCLRIVPYDATDTDNNKIIKEITQNSELIKFNRTRYKFFVKDVTRSSKIVADLLAGKGRSAEAQEPNYVGHFKRFIPSF